MTWLALGGLALVLVIGALSAFANASVRSVKAAGSTSRSSVPR